MGAFHSFDDSTSNTLGKKKNIYSIISFINNTHMKVAKPLVASARRGPGFDSPVTMKFFFKHFAFAFI